MPDSLNYLAPKSMMRGDRRRPCSSPNSSSRTASRSSSNQISQYVLEGTVATEDERFYEHGGFDLAGIARAARA